jgi:hypothetical protein
MLYNLNAGYGGLQKTGIITGKTFVVCPSTHPHFQQLQERFRPDSEGVVRFFSTIAEANAACVSGRGDVVLIADGSYDLGTTALVPVANTKFAAIRQENPRYPSVTITAGAVADMIQVDVDHVVFEGIRFLAGSNTNDNIIDVSDAADTVGFTVKNCVFDGADKTSVVGIQADDATFIPTGMSITGCLFKDLTGTMVDIGVLGMPYALISKNTFAHDVNSGKGIALADTTAFATGKGYEITDNIFLPFDATGDEVGISIAGTENTTGAGIIARNLFSYGAAATSITQDKLSLAMVNNYTGDAATGGTLVDPGT